MTRSFKPSKIGHGCRWVAVLVTCCLQLLSGMSVANAQSSRKAAVDIAMPVVAAKLFKRPLLRSGRIQFCLKQLGRYDGRINGRMTQATARALRRFRDDFDFKAEDVSQDWALHALLWRQCRDEWTRAGGSLDRFGLPGIMATRPASAQALAPKSQAASPRRDASPLADPTAATPSRNGLGTGQCLPAELREILGRSAGRPVDIAVCEPPCLPMPADMDRDDAQSYEKRLGFNWCKSCVPFLGDLLLDDIARIEKAGNLQLCADPRRLMRVRPTATGAVSVDGLRGTRALFRRDVRLGESHNGIAVVIGVAEYGKGLPARPRSERDMSGVQAMLVERLGFKSSRVIELRNPRLAELEDVFGRSGNTKGLLSERLKDGAEAPVFIYFSGLGAMGGDDGEPYLLPSNTLPNRERANGYALATLYQNLIRMGAAQATVVLEVDFASDPKSPLISPNAPTIRQS
ncbi:MAG: caspase family protein, partial [Hyphomicrobiaceae bacterium]